MNCERSVRLHIGTKNFSKLKSPRKTKPLKEVHTVQISPNGDAVKKLLKKRVQFLLRQFPCLTILGARQVGKSTLAQLAFPQFTYVDLENPVDFNRLQMDLPYFFESHRQVIFDEAQTMPELFPALRSHLDKNKKFKGCFSVRQLGYPTIRI